MHEGYIVRKFVKIDDDCFFLIAGKHRDILKIFNVSMFENAMIK